MMKITLLLLLTLPALLVAQEWTMLVYVAADNDLAQWADSDLVEMEQYGSNANISVVVQIDKPSIGAQRLFVGQGSSSLIQNLGIIDMCSWETLSDFLAWGISSFPADRYLVVLWDRLGQYRELHLEYRFDELPEKCQDCRDWMTGSAERVYPSEKDTR